MSSNPEDAYRELVRYLAPKVTFTDDEVEDAVCAQTDPEAFYPETGGSTRMAKRVCRGCPLRAELLGGNDRCLEVALANNERFGIWGGLSERERRKVRDARRDAEARVAA